MAGSIPPLVSSSPPPLGAYDDEEEEDDDEFGMYTAAEEIDYNECISFKEKDGDKQIGCKSRGEQDSTSQDSATDSGLCPDSEGMSPIPHSDDEKTVKQNTCDRLCPKLTDLPVLSSRLIPNCDSAYSECLDKSEERPDSIVERGLTNGFEVANHCDVTEYGEDFGNFENCNFLPAPSLQSAKQGINIDNKSNPSLIAKIKDENGLMSTENINNEQTDQVCQDLSSQLKTFSDSNAIACSEDTIIDPENKFSYEFPKDDKHVDSNYVDQEIINKGIECSETHSLDSKEVDNIEIDDDEFDDFTDFKTNCSSSLEFPETEQSEKLNEFSKHISEQEQSEDTAKSLQVPQEESDDDVSNFADFSSSDCAFVSAQSSNSLENVSHITFKTGNDTDQRTDSEFQDWVSVFPSDVSESQSEVETALLKDNDVVWSRLFPLESSPALTHQWTDSLANRHLLSALNIDSRNILFMPWSNSGVPRFAANLSRGPLEPVKATEPLQPAPQLPPTLQPINTQETVPDAHFDWVSSGLTNPLDYPKPVLNTKKTLSIEAEKILSSFPDLSFMRKTYIDFPISEG